MNSKLSIGEFFHWLFAPKPTEIHVSLETDDLNTIVTALEASDDDFSHLVVPLRSLRREAQPFEERWAQAEVVLDNFLIPVKVVNLPIVALKNDTPHEVGVLPEVELAASASRQTLQHHVEVEAFGLGHVYVDGRIVSRWDGNLPRNLFFYLVDKGMATRAEIFEAFWPLLSTREATNVFHLTKRKITETLGSDLVNYVSGFYRILPDIDLKYDAGMLRKLIQDSATLPANEAMSQLKEAVALYKSSFLKTIDMPWVHVRRQELDELYVEAIVKLADDYEANDLGDEAIGLYMRALQVSPEREDLHRRIRTLYGTLGINTQASARYALEVLLHNQPTPAIQKLAATIRQSDK